MSQKTRSLILAACLLFGLFGLVACTSTTKPTSTRYVDAMEIKLKCRELADQMLATMPNAALEGFVAMPVSFVNKNNTSETSALGRLISEAMFYEFNQRGFPTREYRLTGSIATVGGKNDLALASSQIAPTNKYKWAAVLVGTYLVDTDATFVHARLVRASDGLVLRTGQLVLANTPIVQRLARVEKPQPYTKNGKPIPYPPLYPPLDGGGVTIKQGR